MKKLDEAKWVVLFLNKKRANVKGYTGTMERMLEKVKKLPGFIHLQSFTNEIGIGIAISYWKDRESIIEWSGDSEHIDAQKRGISEWYSNYQIIIAKIEDYYDFKLN